MNLPLPEGLVFSCDSQGNILHIALDTFGFFASNREPRDLLGLADNLSREKLKAFLQEILVNGSALCLELALPLDQRVEVMNFYGLTWEDAISVVSSRHPRDLFTLRNYMVGSINKMVGSINKQSVKLKTSQEEAHLTIRTKSPDTMILDDFMKLNNELVTIQRELLQSEHHLAAKNAHLEQEILERRNAGRELRKANEFSNMVIEMSGSLVVVLNRQGVIVRFNKACEVFTGYRAEEAAGRIFWEFLVPAEDVERVKEVFPRYTASDFPRIHESTWLTKDGSRRFVSWSSGAILNDQGEVEFVIRTGTDLTAEKREQLALNELSSPPKRTSETASSLGLVDLNQAFSERLENLTNEFERLMDLALENLVLKVEHDVSKELSKLVEFLGSLRAGPREATKIYISALKRKVGNVTPSKYQAYSEEGRIMYIELMGKLAVYYRNHCLGPAPKVRAPDRPSEGVGHE